VFSPAANGGLGGFTAQNLNGTPLPRAPEWQLNFGFNYEAPLSEGRKLVFSNNNSYYSRYILIQGTRADFFQPAWFRTDLSVALRGPDDRWEVALIGKNITDKITKGSCANTNYVNGGILGGQITGGVGALNGVSGPAGIDPVQCRADPGREVWLRFTYRPIG
jgi:hypothetical protein